MKIRAWLVAAAFAAIGTLVLATQHAGAFSTPTYYPVEFSSYAGVPCPSSVVANGQGINLGTNCSAAPSVPSYIFNGNDPSGQTMTIGPHWSAVCRDGSVKALPDFTYSGRIPGHGYHSGLMYLRTFNAVCPGYGSYQLYMMIDSQGYGDGESYLYRLMLQ